MHVLVDQAVSCGAVCTAQTCVFSVIDLQYVLPCCLVSVTAACSAWGGGWRGRVPKQLWKAILEPSFRVPPTAEQLCQVSSFGSVDGRQLSRSAACMAGNTRFIILARFGAYIGWREKNVGLCCTDCSCCALALSVQRHDTLHAVYMT